MTSQSIVIPSLLSKKVAQRLHFTTEGLVIDKAGTPNQVTIRWSDIDGVKMKANLIKGLYFNVGNQYAIHLKTDDQRIHVIEMNSVYGIRKRLYEQLWSDAFRLLYDFHFSHLLGYYMELHAIGQIFSLDGVQIYTDGVSWDKRPKIPWDELEVTSYSRYFVLRNRFGIQYRKFLYYGSDWNACLLLDLLKQLISVHNGDVHKSRRQR